MKLPVLSQFTVWLTVASLVIAFSAGWYFNGLRLTAKLETERRQVAEDARKLVEQAQQQAYEAEQAKEAMRRKLAAYKPKVVERVRANPSGCNLPKPVADGLRDQVRATNEAIVSAAGKPA